MLRASIEYHGQDGDLRAVTDGSKSGDTGIEHGERLSTFAEAAVQGDTAALASARDALRNAAGSAAVVDAAGVIANFQRMVRIADGAGIALDEMMVAASEDFRDEIGLNDFQTRRSESLGLGARLAAPLLRGAAKMGLRLAGRRARRTR